MPDSITSGSERSRLLENAGRNLPEFITRIFLLPGIGKIRRYHRKRVILHWKNR